MSRGNQYNPPEELGVIYCRSSVAEDLTPPFGWEFNFVLEDSPTELRLYNDIVDEFRGNNKITEVRTIVNESHTDLSCMFQNCTNLISVNTQDWNTSNVTNMSDMFAMCSSLVSLDLSSFDTSKVTDISFMFFGCNSLKELHLDGCSKDTISKIINSDYFPANNTGTIYCKRAEAAGLTAPGNWQFSYID